MDELFNAWKLRYTLKKKSTDDDTSSVVVDTESGSNSSNNSTINRNDKNKLQSILLLNHRHQKRTTDEDFMIRQREVKGMELLDTIAPFTTDKTKIVDRLEEERLQYLENRLKKASSNKLK